MQKILDAILSDDVDSIGSLPVPETYRGITVHADEADMFAGMPSRDKDPRQSLHLDEVPVPELGPGEALVAVMPWPSHSAMSFMPGPMPALPHAQTAERPTIICHGNKKARRKPISGSNLTTY